MNNVLAQNATQLAISNTSNPEWDSGMYKDAAMRAGERVIKKDSITRERRMINRPKLISSVCADYRAHFAALYGKSDRLPTAVFEQIEKAVDDYIMSTLNSITPVNAISYSRGFHHSPNNMEVTERVRIVGENPIALKEQKFAMGLFINQMEKKIASVPAAIDRDKLKQMNQQLMKMKCTLAFIEGELKHQASLEVTPTV